jgi:glycosyltransferase involved in cell wall biosynthesis
MKLSVIVIFFNMDREARRSLYALSSHYQRGIKADDYEVIVVDNGSTEPLDPEIWAEFGSNFRLLSIKNPHPSPAQAINEGVAMATGEMIGIMIDGAHIVTPGVLRYVLAAKMVFKKPVIQVTYFYLGPGVQNDTILEGYSQTVEDKLLESIQWPDDGYRLFETGYPLKPEGMPANWFNKLFESNCFFMNTQVFHQIGGANLRFDSPGGGFLNQDILYQAASQPETEIVQLIGEGSFHQFHGGTTTGESIDNLEEKVEMYRKQFRQIRGFDMAGLPKTQHFIGHLPNKWAKIHRWFKK